ncbi:Lrp/AsnC family transcriptional regulator [Endobacterium cereale]|uniref:Lrp/AsnC family transcriptional regulator n=1 Tax=Endobacterium cereale TaxID=2663029 RepID=UPI001AD950A9|nr:Lrp/AsnC family transcriptional regulator [Endobacterium cereale]MEB2844471.1 Lrp/AsnC family transcriptional regulator [Endobacterium cereale]
MALDEFDRKILAELQVDGRLSLTDLATKVSLSLSPCHRRVRALEQSGVIQGYSAHLDSAKVGLDFSAIVFVTLREVNRDSVEVFEQAVSAIHEIVLAQRLFGDTDYMLHVVSQSLETFQMLYDDKLTALPSILRLNSTLVMKTVVQNRPLPLGK